MASTCLFGHDGPPERLTRSECVLSSFIVFGLGLAVAAPLAFMGSPASAAPFPANAYDFNGDGLADLAVGAPALTDGKYPERGVAVLAASKVGLSSRAQVLTPDSPGVAGESGAEDSFGETVASGDFDGDGRPILP